MYVAEISESDINTDNIFYIHNMKQSICSQPVKTALSLTLTSSLRAVSTIGIPHKSLHSKSCYDIFHERSGHSCHLITSVWQWHTTHSAYRIHLMPRRLLMNLGTGNAPMGLLRLQVSEVKFLGTCIMVAR